MVVRRRARWNAATYVNVRRPSAVGNVMIVDDAPGSTITVVLGMDRTGAGAVR